MYKLFSLRMFLESEGRLAEGAAWQPLDGGRTNLLWRVKDEGYDWVVKLYRSATENPLFPNDWHAEWATLRALSGTGLAPEVIDLFQTALGACLVYQHSEGASWRKDTAKVAQLLARVHRVDMPVGLRRGPVGGAQVLAQGRAILAGCSGPDVDLLQTLVPAVVDAVPKHLVFLHGDPVPGNLIEGASRLCLIDWQCPALGDPCEDLAIFLSPAMQMLYRGEVLSEEEEEIFLSAYPDEGAKARLELLRPAYHWRMAAYCLWKAGRGAHDYAAAFDRELAALRAASPARRRRP